MKSIHINRIKFSKLFVVFFLTLIIFSSCNDMLSVDSTKYTSADQYNMNAPGDSVYSMFGVLTRLQKLADSYVLLGELRGDLMNVSESSDKYLKEINDFNISPENIYVNIKNYYDVINNCNYIISKLDTNVVDKGLKMKLREYAAVKAIRAWTYMQLALNYKTVKYYEKPILTVADAEKDYSATECNMEQLADKLIADLEPLQGVSYPNLGYIDAYNSSFSYFPIDFVLGDLYLWRGSLTGNIADYESAAYDYHDLMYNNRLIVDKNNSSSWTPVNNTISSDANLNWIRSFSLNAGEVITTIMCPTAYGQSYYLDSLNNHHQIVPSAIAITNWDSQTYYLNEASNAQGDLRKYGSISYSDATNAGVSTDYTFSGVTSSSYLIYKYKLYQQNVIVYRSSLLYLRYAEAVNRLNKPKLAFAVLKYGLNSTNMFNEKIVPMKEKGSPMPTYMNFSDSRFLNNVGIRMRGLGNMDKDTTFYKLPPMASMSDSVLYVEDLIQKELSLETAFEGNRFQDLMRITLRRIKNGEGDASYLADKVALKNPDIRAKLMNPDNWYISK